MNHIVSRANILLLQHAGVSELEYLLDLWERSVRATHYFLSDQDIIDLRPLVKDSLAQIPYLFIMRSPSQPISAFIGVEGEKVEMLFVEPSERGQGKGKALINHVINALNIRYVDVNEQNFLAIPFYQHLGFETIHRSPVDGQGKPFPLLHMKLRLVHQVP